MATNSIPYFHNRSRASQIRVGAKEFMCIGDLPPSDHPHVFIDMGNENEIICPYCATLFVYDPSLNGSCEPAECAFHPEGGEQTAPFTTDVGARGAFAVPAPSSPARTPRPGGISGGLIALFATEETLRLALTHLRSENIGRLQTYTPKFLDDTPMRSPVPLVVLIAGLLGSAGGFGMQVYADMVSYPLDVGGRPTFSWPSFMPIGFEIGVLCAVVAGFFSYLIVAGLPRLYDRIDETRSVHEAMCDGWVVAIRPGDAQAMDRAFDILGSLQPLLIEEIPA